MNASVASATDASRWRRAFIAAWIAMLIAKLVLATRVPVFVDEAFYWLEGQHLAWAYSDLPGLTAWLARVGTTLGGDQLLALRLPFLVLGAALPLLVARIATRELGPADGARAGLLALLMPLAGSLGVLALPDVPMTFAALLCLDASAAALRRVDARVAAELALGLAIGALAHYRFAAVVGIGFVALLAFARGRAALRDPRMIAALAVGALAWIPLAAWNAAHANEGLHFQLVERHPWAFHGDAWRFIVVQAVLATPLLFVALLAAGRRFLPASAPAGARFLAGFGVAFVLAFFVLGFFADRERTSFHWPVPGLLALVALVPAVLASWPRWLAFATCAIAALGNAAMLALYAALAFGDWSAFGGKWYPGNFAGWDALAREVDATLATLPPDTILVADDFKIAATLAFLRNDSDVRVLDHPLNHHHGRAPQLALWGATVDARAALGARPVLLVASPSHVRFSELAARQRAWCDWAGTLSVPGVLDVEGGDKRYFLFTLPAQPGQGECVPPALAHIVAPAPGATVSGRVAVSGWATKDATSVAAVAVTIDGQRVAAARTGREEPFVPRFLGANTRDPRVANTGFDAEIDVSALPPGRHRLGLVLRDDRGREEPGPQQALEVVR